ncbi:hypothetical protein Pelo_4342 [Pelomyxa schiedti]|nr:hypothetical protein Pelo_4342 [Pelomyxa schiedti]
MGLLYHPDVPRFLGYIMRFWLSFIGSDLLDKASNYGRWKVRTMLKLEAKQVPTSGVAGQRLVQGRPDKENVLAIARTKMHVDFGRTKSPSHRHDRLMLLAIKEA